VSAARLVIRHIGEVRAEIAMTRQTDVAQNADEHVHDRIIVRNHVRTVRDPSREIPGPNLVQDPDHDLTRVQTNAGIVLIQNLDLDRPNHAKKQSMP